MERTVGLLGGGQLGQMLCEAANPLGVEVVILDAENSPAKQVNAKNKHVDGSFIDKENILELARHSDVITIEIEHVDTHILQEIEEMGVDVTIDGKKITKHPEIQPHWRTIRTIQDKFIQKQHLKKNGIAVAESLEVAETERAVAAVSRELGFPFMLKARKDAYDGRGNYPVVSPDDIPKALKALGDRGLYAEKWAEFKMELAVMVVKTEDAVDDPEDTIAYPAVETIHEDSICKLVYAPARNVSEEVRKAAQKLARNAVASLWGKGVFGVELFVMPDDTLIVNEIAPRPHNSGHYTIEACPTMSQYKSQLLAILGLMPEFPDNTIPTVVPATIMLNILGGMNPDSHKKLVTAATKIPNAAVHMYGKVSKPGRKIGHITVVGKSMKDGEHTIAPLIKIVDAIRAERKDPNYVAPEIVLPAKKYGGLPLIAVTMGSDSDLPVVKPGLAILKKFGVPFTVDITSAHRTPARMTEFAENAAARGYKVIIAAAGGAAHLPGMIAASTALPVIGIPVKCSTLDGMDSLLSIVQMPRGVPVASVAINNSTNAALLALRILGASDTALRNKVEAYALDAAEEVIEKAEKLGRGWEEYEVKN